MDWELGSNASIGGCGGCWEEVLLSSDPRSKISSNSGNKFNYLEILKRCVFEIKKLSSLISVNFLPISRADILELPFSNSISELKQKYYYYREGKILYSIYIWYFAIYIM